MQMSSNSKLNKDQKADRRALIASLPAGSTMAMSTEGFTALVVPSGAVNMLYTSVASPDEQKLRRKVGEFHALMRWADGCFGTPIPRYWDAAMVVGDPEPLKDVINHQREF
jgi:hypothetical protein